MNPTEEFMSPNEDHPEDVRDATPVEETLKKGETDEISVARTKTASNAMDGYQRFQCKKNKPIQKIDCCEVKRQKYAASKNQYVKMLVHGRPCKVAKIETIPRHCMTTEEYLDFLSAPKKSCPTQCAMREEIRRVRSVRPRISELARPTRRRLILTLQERGATMPAWALQNMIEMLEEETALTPEQAEHLVRDRANTPRAGAKKRKKPPPPKCDSKSARHTSGQGGAGEPCVDLEAASCQYNMALRFVRSIFNWRCCHPREDYRDIAEVVLERLSETLEYAPTGSEDRKSQQMRILADVYACWIADILMEVSDRHRAELEEECQRKKREAEELAAREAMLAAETYDDDDLSRGSASLEGEDDRLTNADSCSKTIGVETIDFGVDTMDTGTQYEESVLDLAGEEDEGDKEEIECDQRPEEEPAQEEEPAEELVDEEQQTEEEEKVCVETEIEPDTQKSMLKSCKSKSELELDNLACRMSSSFSDVPFVTFGKIFDTIYCMIECEAEDSLECPEDKRIHRAIYDKFVRALGCEDPELLTERMKDVVDVISGKIALFLRKTLNEQHLRYMEQNPALVESRELRDWSKWIINVATVGEDWSNWIRQIAEESRAMKKTGGVTRGKWESWTSKFEQNASLWRRAYQEAMHQQHHNTMMITDRKVVKTGGLKRIDFDEKTIKSTKYDSSSR